MPEEATEIRDKDQLYFRRFDKRLRDHLKTLISPELIEEHRLKPLGQHSDRLERVLNYFRMAGGENKYVLYEMQTGTAYKIIATTGIKGTPPRDVDDVVFTNKDDALHAVFLRRVQDLMDS